MFFGCFLGCLLDTFWMSFGCVLAIFWMFLDVFWISFGYLLDVFWISLRLLDGLDTYQELALLVVTNEKPAKNTYIR